MSIKMQQSELVSMLKAAVDTIVEDQKNLLSLEDRYAYTLRALFTTANQLKKVLTVGYSDDTTGLVEELEEVLSALPKFVLQAIKEVQQLEEDQAIFSALSDKFKNEDIEVLPDDNDEYEKMANITEEYNDVLNDVLDGYNGAVMDTVFAIADNEFFVPFVGMVVKTKDVTPTLEEHLKKYEGLDRVADNLCDRFVKALGAEVNEDPEEEELTPDQLAEIIEAALSELMLEDEDDTTTKGSRSSDYGVGTDGFTVQERD